MKISFFMPKLDIGGIERVFITYANELDKRGYDIDFVLCVSGGTLQPLLNKKIKVFNLGNIKLRKALFPLRNYLKKEKPIFLFTGSNLQNLISIIAGYKLKTKIVISQHNYFDIDTQQTKWAFVEQKAMRIIYPHADCIIAISKGIKEYLINSIKIKENKITYLPNPIDIEATKNQAKQYLPEKLPNKYIVFIGRLSPVKNLKLLIHAFDCSNINDTHLLIVGDGIDKENIEHEVENIKKKDKVIFVGKKSNPLPYLANASCLVLCSYSEAMPAILLESMALNIPIIATPTKGAIELIANTNGNYIGKSFDDIYEYKELIEKIYNNKNVYFNDIINTYSSNYIVDKLENIFKRYNSHENCN